MSGHDNLGNSSRGKGGSRGRGGSKGGSRGGRGGAMNGSANGKPNGDTSSDNKKGQAKGKGKGKGKVTKGKQPKENGPNANLIPLGTPRLREQNDDEGQNESYAQTNQSQPNDQKESSYDSNMFHNEKYDPNEEAYVPSRSTPKPPHAAFNNVNNFATSPMVNNINSNQNMVGNNQYNSVNNNSAYTNDIQVGIAPVAASPSTTGTPVPPAPAPAPMPTSIPTPVDAPIIMNPDPNWPASLNKFYIDSMARIGNLKQSKQLSGKQQLANIIEMALSQNLTDNNDWANQRVPILNGGGKLELEMFRAKNKSRKSQSTNESKEKSLATNNSFYIDVNGDGPYDPTSKPATSKILQGNNNNDNNVNKNKKKNTNNKFKGDNKKSKDTGNNPQQNGNKKRHLQEEYNSEARKRARAERFAQITEFKPLSTYYEQRRKDSGAVVGTSDRLEKNYFRLTSAPNPAEVRSPKVLHNSLKYVISKYNTTNDYSYIIDQLKSIRQDLTVQHIKDDFTIHVYEKNARISIKHDDLGEFNQCQGQLKPLYHRHRINNEKYKDRFMHREVEMMTYSFIYMIVTRNQSEINRFRLQFLKYKYFRKYDYEKPFFRLMDALFKSYLRILQGDFEIFFSDLEKFEHIKEIELAFNFIRMHLLNKARLEALYQIVQSYRKFPVFMVSTKLRFPDPQTCLNYLVELGLKDCLINGNREIDIPKTMVTMHELMAKHHKVDIKGQI